MAENFITFPTSDLDVDNLPTTLTNAILSTTTSVSGLTNGTAYRTFVLSNPSGSFTPAAAAAGVTRIAARTVVDSGTNEQASYSGSAVTASAGSSRMAILVVATGTVATPNTSLTATWGAQAFTQLDISIGGSSRSQLWIGYIKEADIPAGSNAITVTPNIAGTAGMIAFLIEYGGVDQTTPFGTPYKVNRNAELLTEDVSITMTAADSMMLCGVSYGGAGFPATTVGATEVKDERAGGTDNAGVVSESFPAATGVETHSFTWSATVRAAVVAVEVFPA